MPQSFILKLYSETQVLCVHFCKINGLQPERDLKLYRQQLPVEEQVKFLGLFFDKKLSFTPHIKYMKDKCRKALQLLRVISSKDWGGDRTTLLKIYRSHIRSKLDYGCIVYGSARRSYLAVLDPIANQGLRLCSGAFRTSPIESLQVETGEPSLETRRLKLSLQYYMKMKANPENPAYSCVVNPEYKRLFNNKPGTIPPLGIRLQPHLEDMEVELDAISVVRPPECPPWLLQQPNILFNLSDLRKGDTLSSRACCWSYFVDFRGTGRCILTDQRKTREQLCPLSVMIMNLAAASTMRLQFAQQNC